MLNSTIERDPNPPLSGSPKRDLGVGKHSQAQLATVVTAKENNERHTPIGIGVGVTTKITIDSDL